MYLEFYSLREKPFSLTPDPAFLYYSNAHKRAVAFLKYGLQESKGFLQLTGPVGSGKTTLLRVILSELDEKTKTAYIINPCASFPDLLRSIMKDLEIPNIPQTRLKIELLDFFHDYLLIQMRRSNPVIIIFDEAQNLSLKNLEEIRMLSNFETTKEKLLQIVFVGQPELMQTLDLPELRQLKQRIQVRYHLSPLKLQEVKAYINHRLRIAGSDGGLVFTDEACAAIYDFSAGIPRLINSVCDVALLIGYVNERKTFDRYVVEEAIREMEGSFDDAPSAGKEEKSSPAMKKKSRGKEASLNRDTADSLPGPSLSSGDSPKDSSLVLDQDPESVPERGNSGSKCHVHQAGLAATAAETVADPMVSSEDSESSSGYPDSMAPRETRSRARNRTNESEKALNAPSSPLVGRVSGNAPRKPESGFLRSLLRYGATRKFKVRDSIILKPAESKKGVRARTREFIQKGVSRRNGSYLSTKKRRKQGLGDNQQSGAIAGAFQSRNVPEKRNTRRYGKWIHPVSHEISHKAGVSSHNPGSKTMSGEKGRSSRVSGGCPLSRRVARLIKQPSHRKILIVFKDRRVVSGVIENLNLTAPGFHYSHPGIQRFARKEFVTFEQIAAVRLMDNLRNDWENAVHVSGHSPKGRQILVTLANGEVIGGITLSKFDPDCKRFFVVSPNGDGEASWVLVERSGTAGISTESLREGIYAEEFEPLGNSTEIPKTGTKPACRHESAGDNYFRLNDYPSALSEYQKALANGTKADQLTLKISLSHFNLGIRYLRENKYDSAREEFEKSMADDHLREKALSKIRIIENLLRT